MNRHNNNKIIQNYLLFTSGPSFYKCAFAYWIVLADVALEKLFQVLKDLYKRPTLLANDSITFKILSKQNFENNFGRKFVRLRLKEVADRNCADCCNDVAKQR